VRKGFKGSWEIASQKGKTGPGEGGVPAARHGRRRRQNDGAKEIKYGKKTTEGSNGTKMLAHTLKKAKAGAKKKKGRKKKAARKTQIFGRDLAEFACAVGRVCT